MNIELFPLKNIYTRILIIHFLLAFLPAQDRFEDWYLPLGLQDEGWYPPTNHCVDYAGNECPAGNPAGDSQSCESYAQCNWEIHWNCVNEDSEACVDDNGQTPSNLSECNDADCDWVTTDCGGTYGGIWDGMCFGYPDTIYIGLSDTASNGFRYGEDQINTPILEASAPLSDTYFYHSDWFGDVDVNGVACEWVRFSTDIREYNELAAISEWEVQATFYEIPPEVDYYLTWPDFDLPEDYDIFLYLEEHTYNMRMINSVTVERDDLVPSFGDGGFHSKVIIRIGGCLQEGPETFYIDEDMDGLGTGEGVLMCTDSVEPGWVDNDLDSNDSIYCESDIIDECGICDGNGISEYFIDMDGDGLGVGEGMELCPYDVDDNMVQNNGDINDDIYCVTNVIDPCLVCDGEDNDLGCGCFQSAPESYYFDGDGDGLGSGDEFTFCENLNDDLQYDIPHYPELPEGYVTNNNDSNDEIFCESDSIDDCYMCEGTNTTCNVFGDGITGFSAIYRSHSGNIELDWSYNGNSNASRGIIIIEFFDELNHWTILDSTFEIDNGEFDFPGTVQDTGRVLGAVPYDRFYNCYQPSFTDGDACLEYAAWETVTFEQTVEWVFDLTGGNNLISFPALPYDNSLQNILGDYEEKFYYVISQGIAAFHSDSDNDGIMDQWSGNLNEFLPNLGYWVSIHPDSTMEFRVPDGYLTSPDYNYELVWGNNLVSYVGTDYVATLDAIPQHVEDVTKFIIGQGVGYFHLDTDYDGIWDTWSGNLNNLRVGKGYWLNLLYEPDDSVYNMVWDDGQNVAKSVLESPNIEDLLSIDDFSFNQSSQQGFYLVRNLELPESIPNNGLLIAYYDDVILGYRQWYGEFTDIPVMGKDNSMGTELYIVEGQTPNFKYYELQSGELYSLTSDNLIPSWSPNNFVVLENLQVENKESEIYLQLPSELGLLSVYPNPFNPVCQLQFELINDSKIALQIYDINGKFIVELANSDLMAGRHVYTWNAKYSPSGIYLAKLVSPSGVWTKKLLLLK